jgi:hypothetical protein
VAECGSMRYTFYGGIGVGAYNDALTPVFLFMAPLALLAALVLAFIKHTPLATTVQAAALAESLDIDGLSGLVLAASTDQDAELALAGATASDWRATQS